MFIYYPFYVTKIIVRDFLRGQIPVPKIQYKINRKLVSLFHPFIPFYIKLFNRIRQHPRPIRLGCRHPVSQSFPFSINPTLEYPYYACNIRCPSILPSMSYFPSPRRLSLRVTFVIRVPSGLKGKFYKD